MRAVLFSLAMLLPLAACALPQTSNRFSSPDAPLRASIWAPTSNGITFQVNRPAHVALFQIVPGGGVSMVYPRFGIEEGLQRAGNHFASTRGVWNRGLNSLDSPFSYASGMSRYGARLQQPIYLFMIASEAPLRISDFVGYHSSLALRSALGFSRFAAFNPYSTMEDVAALVLPLQGGGDWATDVYTYWPESRFDNNVPRYRAVYCQNGRQILVPLHSGVTACPGDQRNRGEAPPLRAPTPGDSAEVNKPSRRRPVAPDGPIADDDARSERIDRIRQAVERDRIAEPEGRAIMPRHREPAADRGERRSPRMDRPSPRMERPSSRGRSVDSPRSRESRPSSRVRTESRPPRTEARPTPRTVSRPSARTESGKKPGSSERPHPH